MGIGPAVRRRLGSLETPAAELYRKLFFDVDDFGLLAKRSAPAEVKRILEIGCGDGAVADRITAAFPLADYLGIDVAAEPGRRFNGDAERVTFRSMLSGDLRAERPEPFDLVMIVDVLHHIPDNKDRISLLSDAAEMLAAGGSLLVKEWERVNTPAYAAGWASDYFISGDRQVRYMARGELSALIELGASSLAHTGVKTTKPWDCNVVHVLRAS